MENEVQLFKFEDDSVRVMEVNGEAWFVGKDVANALGYKDTKNALKLHVDSDDKLGWQITTSGQRRNVTIINESGVYSLIFGSKLPSAKRFKKWVTAEVLPSIRKHGAYMTEDVIQKTLTSPDYLIELATKMKEEMEARKRAEQQVLELEPRAKKFDQVVDSRRLLTFEAVSHMTVEYVKREYGLDVTLNKITFPQLLRAMGILTKDKIHTGKNSGYKNLPRKDYQELFAVKTTAFGTMTKVKPEYVVELMEVVAQYLVKQHA